MADRRTPSGVASRRARGETTSVLQKRTKERKTNFERKQEKRGARAHSGLAGSPLSCVSKFERSGIRTIIDYALFFNTFFHFKFYHSVKIIIK